MHAGKGVGAPHRAMPGNAGGEIDILLPAIQRQLLVEPVIGNRGGAQGHVAAIKAGAASQRDGRHRAGWRVGVVIGFHQRHRGIHRNTR